MTIHTIDDSQRQAAKVAGFTFLFGIALVIFSNFSINFRYIIPDEAAQTARNIIAHQTLFRVNVVCNLIYLVTLIVMFTSLYVILKPVNRSFALAAVFFRLIYALLWGIMALNTFAAMRLLGDAAYLSAFEADQLQTLSRLPLSSSWDAYYVGLPFWGFASLVCSFLWFRSAYIPKALAVFGIVASLWCVICSFIFIIFPAFEETVNVWYFDMPLVIFETTLGFWLLFKGLRGSGIVQPD